MHIGSIWAPAACVAGAADHVGFAGIRAGLGGLSGVRLWDVVSALVCGVYPHASLPALWGRGTARPSVSTRQLAWLPGCGCAAV